MNEEEQDKVYDLIKAKPGTTAHALRYSSGYSENLIDILLTRLRVQGWVNNVGSKYYALADYPDIAPDLTLVYKVLRSKGGISLQQLIEEVKLPANLVREEVKFLIRQGDVYEYSNKLYPRFTPDPVGTHQSILNVDLMTRQELEAIAKLYIQLVTWGHNSLQDVTIEINKRSVSLTPESERKTSEEQHGTIQIEGKVNLS